MTPVMQKAGLAVTSDWFAESPKFVFVSLRLVLGKVRAFDCNSLR